MFDTLILAAEDPSKVNPVVPHTAEIILGLVAFLLLFFVIKKFVSPRFEALYAERTAKIEGGIEKAEQAQAEAQRTLEQYKEQLAEARAEGLQIIEELREQAQAESARIVAQGQHQLDAQRAQIIAELRADLGRTAVELASKVVGESLEDEARRRGTVDRFLNELDAVAAPANK